MPLALQLSRCLFFDSLLMSPLWEWARTLHMTGTPCFTLTLKSYFRPSSSKSSETLTLRPQTVLWRNVCLSVGKAYRSEKGVRGSAYTSSSTDFDGEKMDTTPSCLEIHCEIRSLFKALLKSILSSHETVSSTRMKESVAVDANTKSGRLPLSCSTLWQCLFPCRSAETSQSLALESKFLLCFSFFSLRYCDKPSLKKYILLVGAVSRAFGWEHAVFAASSTICKTWLCRHM